MRLVSLFFTFLLFMVDIQANEKEDLLKGVILERISQFVTYKDTSEDFLICVYKNKQMTNVFSDLFQQRKHRSEDIRIVNISSIKNINTCDIFYAHKISKSTKKMILKKNLTYTLLVTDDVKLLDDGFMLALYLQKNKIRFAINHQAIVDAQLKINYRLLKVASKVINPLKVQR